MSKTALWEAHRSPAKDACKSFKKQGGFAGTAIDPMWLILEATREWGPMGCGWGYDVINESVERLSDEWILHTCNIELWYGEDAQHGRIPSTGNTWMVSPGKYGPRYDDEASKKSRTDAISKALSWLGFGADVHMGIFDGNKYADLFEEPATKPTTPEPTTEDSDHVPKSTKKDTTTDDMGQDDAWTSSIPDDILDIVRGNYKTIKEQREDCAEWHTKILKNLLGVSVKEDQLLKDVISGLSREQLEELAGHQKIIMKNGE